MKVISLLLLVFIASFVSSPSIVAQSARAPSDSVSAELYERGTEALLQGDRNHAIMYYRTLMDREKESPSLSRAQWRFVVDNLGMAYAISGKLDSAEKVFKYGVGKDSTYTLFYFNLACTYAERGDMNHAIGYLKIAYQFKDKTAAGETFPDPMSVDPFQRFVNNKAFVDAVKEMQRK